MPQDNPYEKYRRSGGPSPVVIGAPDPTIQSKERRAENEDARDAARLGISQAAESRMRATLPADVAKAEADARKAQIEADRAAAEAAKAPKPGVALIQQSIKTSALMEALNTARDQIGAGWSTGNFFGGGSFSGIAVAGQNATDLSATLIGLKGSILTDTLERLKAQSATGSSGMGSLTEKEGERLAASVGALQQDQSEASLLRNLAKVERHYRNMLALSYGEDPRVEDVQQRYGILPPKDDGEIPGANGPDPGGQVTSQGNTGIDPTLGGLNSAVERMVRRGKSAEEIRAYLNMVRPGMGDAAQDVEAAVNYGRQNPDKPVGVDLEKVWRPAGGVSQTLGDIGMSQWGSGVIGAADALTMGTLDNMTGNPALTRATMDGVQAANPWPYLIGQLGGGGASGLVLEAGLARAGIGGLTGIRTGEALYGAGYGAGSADDPEASRIGGAALGAGSGLVGGALGRGASRIGGTLVGGIRDDVVKALNNAGVRMTPGQIAGGTIQRTEDRLAGLPFVGDQIRARRVEGLEDFNRAAFKEAVDPINGAIGDTIAEPGIEILRALRSRAYDDALNPVRVTADAPFVSDLGGVISSAQRLPATMAENADYTLRSRIGEAIDPSGNFSGRDYQQMLRGLRRDASSLEDQPYGYDFAQITRQAEGALEGVLQRQSPGTVEALRSANEANRRIETLRDAVSRARNGSASGQTGVFSPAQLSTAADRSARLYGNSQGTTNQPFYELTRAGQSVLPSSVPDSGTAGRLVLPTVLAALAGGGGIATGDTGEERAGYGATGAVIGGLLASAPYSAASRTAIQNILLAERPRALQQAGDIMVNNDTIAGLLASPLLVEYTAGR